MIITKSGINEDDAMLSKKHLGPQACASCDKNLINISGMPVDYHVWKKLPFLDQFYSLHIITKEYEPQG